MGKQLPRYEKPRSLDEALGLLAEGSWRILAGGTDFYPAQATKPIGEDVLDINSLQELRGIVVRSDGVRIGARTTWTDMVRADFSQPALDALKQAAREVGGVQIQNAGTVAGNICNASPAADGVPALLAVDAEVELASLSGVRRLPLSNFILGNRRTARRPEELLTAIHIPASSLGGVSRFIKLGARRYLVISIAMAAARIVARDGRVAEAAVAVGACSEVAQRLRSLEAALIGARIEDVGRVVASDPFIALAPLDDVRGTAAYRIAAAREIVARAIGTALAASAASASREAAA